MFLVYYDILRLCTVFKPLVIKLNNPSNLKSVKHYTALLLTPVYCLTNFACWLRHFWESVSRRKMV